MTNIISTGFKSISGMGGILLLLAVPVLIIAFLTGWTLLWNFGTFVKILMFILGLWIANIFIFGGKKNGN